MQAMRESQKMFLQHFMSRGMLNTKEVKKLYGNVSSKYQEEPNQLQQFVVTINANIKQFNLDIKKGIGEENGTHYYVLVNTQATDITLKATDYASYESEFFKKLITAIIYSDDGTIGSIDATNLADAIKERKMRREEAQNLLDRLEAEKWISKTDGMISLSTRTLLELEQYIQDVYENVVLKCEMCSKICVKGQKCTRCDTKLHTHCAAKCFEKQNDAKCPASECKAPWPYAVGSPKRSNTTEDADMTMGEDESGSSHNAPAEPQHNTRKRGR